MITLKKRKSVTSKLALQFKLILCCLVLSNEAAAVLKDRYLFRISDVVVGVNDMSQAYDDLHALHCRFSDSLLSGYLGDGFEAKLKKTNEKLKNSTEPLAQDNNSIIFLANVRQLWKLLVYVDGQEVALSSDLEKAVLHTGGCPTVLLDKKMRDSFRRWLRVEVYLRSRYAPGGMGGGAEWRGKRLQSITQFVDSLDKQFNHENFW